MKTTNKAFIAGRIYNVIEVSELNQDYIQYYNGTLAIHYKNFILPVYLQSNGRYDKPGAYYDYLGSTLIEPYTPEDKELYSDSHIAYFGSVENLQDVINAKEKLYKDEFNHLVSSDDVFVPNIDQSQDTALMFAVKSAIAAKQCNINNYAERFGADFNNDKRKFNGNSITAGKAETILSNTDVRVTLVVQDMTPDVPNPIGNTLVFPWIGDGINDEAYVNYINEALSAAGNIKL